MAYMRNITTIRCPGWPMERCGKPAKWEVKNRLNETVAVYCKEHATRRVEHLNNEERRR